MLAIRTQSKIVNKQKIVNNCLGPRVFTISGGLLYSAETLIQLSSIGVCSDNANAVKLMWVT